MNKKIFSIIVIAPIFILAIFGLPEITFSQSIVDSLEQNGQNPCKDSGDCTVNDMVRLLVIGADFIIRYSGVLALVAFIYGGILFLTSAGQSDRVTKGKNVIVGSLIGLAIVFFSYTIVQFIGESLGITDFGFSTRWFP